MISISTNTPMVDGRVPLDTAEPAAHAEATAHEAPGAPPPDPVAAFAANFGLHPQVAPYSNPKRDPHGTALPLEAKKEKPSLASPPPTAQCQVPASSYDVSTVSDADIDALRKCGHGRLADTIVNAKKIGRAHV